MAREHRIHKSLVPYEPLPPDLSPDHLTRYVYEFYWDLLTEDERGAQRYRIYRTRVFRLGVEADPHVRKFFRIQELERDRPDLMDRIRSQGVAAVMAAARDRVLQAHGAELVLNRCSACGSLCRTPRARQCLECGHDWHQSPGASGR